LDQIVYLHASRELGHQVVGNPLYQRRKFIDVLFSIQRIFVPE
jgi:hypothetical protein